MTTDLFVPPRTWGAWLKQIALAAVVAVVLLVVVAVVVNDPPWGLIAVFLVVVLIASALGTAVRMRKRR